MAATTAILILCIWAVVTNVESAHHAAAPAPAVDCSSVILNMADCLSYVTAGSTVQKPEGTCCSGLKTVLKSNPECICEAFKNSAQLGVSLNMTKALALPSACHLSAPSATKCGMDLGVAGAPAHSPMAGGAEAPNSALLGPGVAPAPVAGSTSSSSGLVNSAMILLLGLLFSVSLSSY